MNNEETRILNQNQTEETTVKTPEKKSGKGEKVAYAAGGFAAGLAAGVAGTLVGAYWFLMLCGRLLGGVVGGKVSSKAMMVTVSALAILFILLGMFLPSTLTMTVLEAQVPVAILFFVACGLCTSVMQEQLQAPSSC